ncbi:MAG: hypothetical protein ACREV7_20000 [Steroidobacteraceae bacterium]
MKNEKIDPDAITIIAAVVGVDCAWSTGCTGAAWPVTNRVASKA